ncbi:hypothetical protein [Nostoc sp. XA010]|nr:hypothetical protein [Nostoc sp. XA010]
MSLTEMGIWSNGYFGLTLLGGVRLWSVIGWWRWCSEIKLW